MNGDRVVVNLGWQSRRRLEDMTHEDLCTLVRTLEQGLKDVQEQAKINATVIGEHDGMLHVHTGDQVATVRKPAHMKIDVPQFVHLVQQTGALGAVSEAPLFGPIARVLSVLEDRRLAICVFAHDVQHAVLYAGAPPEPGDRVLCDIALVAITCNLGKEPSELVLSEPTGVSWDDIGGCADVKAALREAVEDPIVHRELYKEFNEAPPKGILLHGPPGCGKTMFAKAVATSVAAMHGASAMEGGYIAIKGPELLSKWIGATEEGVRSIFKRARTHQDKHGYPAVVCIDEADALLSKRGTGMSVGGGEGIEKTSVPQFLAEMDGIGESGALVLLLTNRPEILDPAVVRAGRVDRKVEVRRPTQDEAAEVAALALRGKPLEGDAKELAAHAAACVFADKESLYVIRTKSGEKDERVRLRHFVSGAMMVGIVEKASKAALRRGKTRAAADDAATGPVAITKDDLRAAAAAARTELRGLDHSKELKGLIDALPEGEFVKVEPVARKS